VGFEPTSARIRSTPAVGPKFGPLEAVTAGVDIRESPSTERALEPTTPGLEVRDPSDEPATQAPPAGIRVRMPIDEASPDDLPEKQVTARGRPLVTYVRCDVTSGLERETGIEPV